MFFFVLGWKVWIGGEFLSEAHAADKRQEGEDVQLRISVYRTANTAAPAALAQALMIRQSPERASGVTKNRNFFTAEAGFVA